MDLHVGALPRPQRLQRRRTRGWRAPADTVYVGRPSRWGNPFRVGIEGTAAACVTLFEARYVQDTAYRVQVRTVLAGKHLSCWCPLDAPCHADVLLRWAEELSLQRHL